MLLHSGHRLGPYEILAPLGAGGMGEVYRARDSRLGREVAVKVLPATLSTDPERLARLEREARTVAALNHPGIVTLHSLEEADGVRFLTMELVEGETLDRALAAGPVPLPRALALALALAEALAAAHARGVVHRDLKPANVMVTRDGRIKVLDFGLARVAPSAPDLDLTQAATMVTPVSTPGQTVGTVPYMAPEQLRGAAAGPRADLFAFGIVLHELLTARRPFAGSTHAEVATAILRDAPAPLADRLPGAPAELERLVARCLAKDERDRPASAEDVAHELRYLQRQAVPAEASAVRPGPPAPAPADSDSARAAAPSIAVLPFASRSRDPEDEHFADGLADELTSVLTRIRGLRVAARTSAFQFKGRHDEVARIGQKLGVATLLEGTLRRAGDRVRITVQLVQVADGFHLWSEVYDRTLDDIFAVQDDIAQSVVRELRRTLFGGDDDSAASGRLRAEVEAAATGRGGSAEAHRLYLQARVLASRMGEESLASAIALYQGALALDPGHARAWAGLAWSELLSAIITTGEVEAGIARARAALERAAGLQPDLAEVHTARGALAVWYDFDWGTAEASYTLALELAPGDAGVLALHGLLHMILGRLESAERMLQRAVELDPLSPVSWASLGRLYLCMERHDEAVAHFRQALTLAPDAVSLRGLEAIGHAALGRDDEALATADAEPADWARHYSRCLIHTLAGRHDAARTDLAALIAIASDSAAYQIALGHALLGDIDAAFAWLDRGYAQRDSGLSYMRVHWMLRPLHGDPRWGAFLRRMGLGT